jgi:hypothetical protein
MNVYAPPVRGEAFECLPEYPSQSGPLCHSPVQAFTCEAKDILTSAVTGCVNVSTRRAVACRTLQTKPMKFKTLLTFVAAISMGFTAIAADEDTPLSKQMTTMNKSLRALKRNLADPAKKEENLALVKKIQDAQKEAAKLEPKKTPEQKDKVAYLAKFKEEMDGLSKTFEELEGAIKADKPDEAKKVLEKLSEQKEKGHKDFGVDD